ncbi:UDP-glycosyltransferase UGT5-like [Arctopsyche grandis]|uniref:UDP-glycosyltransferase UGT5-like n=1 Tax=Arctopsyche grandis TaxID=121162 RepID=UPI00406D7DF1
MTIDCVSGYEFKLEMKLLGIVALLIQVLIQQTSSARILVLLPFSGKSHFIFMLPIVNELVNRGHDLTVIAPYEEKNAKYTQIIVEKRMLWELLGEKPDIFALETIPFEATLDLVWSGGYFTTESAFNASNVKRFIKEDNSHFDLIISEVFYQEAMYMFAHKYKAPLIGICTMGYTQFIGASMGSPLLPSYMAHEFLNLDQPMTFSQRMTNLYSTLFDLFWRHWYLLPKHQRLAEKSFPDLPQPLPSLEDLEKNFSLVLINSHFSYDIVRPYVPGIIEIGGVHIKNPKPLPENIKKFLDEAKHGAVFFSFGSNLQSKDMPVDKLKVFLNVFKSLKQRVLWKWEDENLEGKPDNVLLGKWLPQSDILAHPNVKVFITHGGLLSTQEAMYHGVPIIGLPFYGDQHLNTERVDKTGFGKKLKFVDLNEKLLTESIEELVYKPHYQNKAKSLADSFKDRPMTPLETSIYWIEYVIRHKGASVLKSPAVDMSIFVYFLIDLFLFFALVLFSIFIIVYGVCKYFTRSSKGSLYVNGKKHN